MFDPVHSCKAWLGRTNGHGTAKDIHAAYRKLNYGFHAGSNYHNIDTTESELSQLDGYDCMEVLNPSVVSTTGWDAALSAGKKVFIVGNDDMHDVVAKVRLGKMCTFVNVSENKAECVFRALKNGESWACFFLRCQQEHLQMRRGMIDVQAALCNLCHFSQAVGDM